MADSADLTFGKLATSGSAAAFGTALAFLVTYVYRAGAANYFNIPVGLVVLSWSDVLAGLLAVAGMTFFILTFGDIVVTAFHNAPVKGAVRQRISRDVIIVVALVAVWVADDFSAAGLGVIAGILFVLIALDWGLVFLLRKRGTPLEAHVEELEQRRHEAGPQSLMMRAVAERLGSKRLLIVAACGWLLLCAYIRGGANAGAQTRYFVLTSEPNRVVLQMYGDRLVTDTFDRRTRQLGDDITAINFGNTTGLRLRLETTGRLKPPPSS